MLFRKPSIVTQVHKHAHCYKWNDASGAIPYLVSSLRCNMRIIDVTWASLRPRLTEIFGMRWKSNVWIVCSFGEFFKNVFSPTGWVNDIPKCWKIPNVAIRVIIQCFCLFHMQIRCENHYRCFQTRHRLVPCYWNRKKIWFRSPGPGK